MKPYHHVMGLRFAGNVMILTIDSQERRFQVSDISPALQHASAQERNLVEISPSGYGIHWPLLDEDLSIDGLLGVFTIRKRPQKAPSHTLERTGGTVAVPTLLVQTRLGGGVAARR